MLDISSTCQHSDPDSETTIFLGSHSAFSNLYGCKITIDNVSYDSVEQYIQSEKAKVFDDDTCHSRIMRESNPYKIKKLGGKVKHYSQQKWRSMCKEIAYKGVMCKFAQNKTLSSVLLNTSDATIAESSTDTYWGTGIHLHDKNALVRSHWKSGDGGVMCGILQRVRHELHQH